jgi:hypothetical protein
MKKTRTWTGESLGRVREREGKRERERERKKSGREQAAAKACGNTGLKAPAQN